jgi:hypothetical protein
VCQKRVSQSCWKHCSGISRLCAFIIVSFAVGNCGDTLTDYDGAETMSALMVSNCVRNHFCCPPRLSATLKSLSSCKSSLGWRPGSGMHNDRFHAFSLTWRSRSKIRVDFALRTRWKGRMGTTITCCHLGLSNRV